MDFLASKGIEYLMVIGYLLACIPFWLLFARRAPRATAVASESSRGWFVVPEGPSYHRGHTWAAPRGGTRFRVGIDDFARCLLGRPDGVELPPPGGTLSQGEVGFGLRIGGRVVDLLSPVTGRVVAVNPDVVADPARIATDPYGEGWLVEVEGSGAGAWLTNLLPARLARSWMAETEEKLSLALSEELGPVLQDGGLPVPGFARELSAEGWADIAAQLLLTGAATQAGPRESGATSR